MHTERHALKWDVVWLRIMQPKKLGKISDLPGALISILIRPKYGLCRWALLFLLLSSG